jgi:hypothetical protein
MLINTDLSTETSAQSLQQKRSEASGASSQVSSASTQDTSTASQLDPLLQRLTAAPFPVQDGGPEIEDEAGAAPIMNSLFHSMSNQPAMAMGAQANQLSQNVLSLLQSID